MRIALTLILMTARRAGEGERLVRAGRWKGWHPTQMLGMHVTGRTVGIIGMGRIGQAIARRCHGGFAMQVLFHNRRGVTGLGFPARQVPLPELLASSDIVVLAVPGGAETRHLIGADQLAAMQPHAILINIARGDVVDEEVVVDDNLITSRKPDDIPAFNQAIIAALTEAFATEEEDAE